MADGKITISTEIDKSGIKVGMKEIKASVKRVSDTTGSIGEKAEAATQKQIAAFAKLSKEKAKQHEITIHHWQDHDAGYEVDDSEKARTVTLNERVMRNNEKLTESLIESMENYSNAADTASKKTEKFTSEAEKAGEGMNDILQNAEVSDEEIISLREELQKLLQRQEELKTAGVGLGYEEFDQNVERIAEINAELKAYRRSLVEIEAETEAEAGKMGLFLNQISQKLIKSGIAGMKRKLHELGRLLDNLMKKFMQLTSGAIVGGLKKISGGIFAIHKSANKSTLSLKNLLKYAFGIRTLFVLFNKIRGAISEGIQNLAEYDLATHTGTVNQSLSELKGALTQLKNSFATAFAPILTVAAPILVQFINLISQAVTRVGMLIAALTGQKTFVKAIAVQENYAASLDNTANSAKKAAKALQGYLSPIDEINRYDDGKDSSGSTGSGGKYTGPSAGDMFEEVPIESSLKGIADKVKELIKNEDWEGLGAYMADGINKGLQKVYNVISWDNVGPKVTAFVRAFTETFNSLADHVDWDLMGRTLGAGINTAINTLNLLIGDGGIDFNKIGSSIAKALRSAIREIDWKSLGQLLGNKFMVSWKLLSGFIQEMSRKSDAGITGWTELGKSIGRAMTGMFEKISFKDIANAIVGVINGAFEILAGVDAEFDWDAFQENLKEGIETAINGIEWKKNGKAFGDFLSNLCETLRGALTKNTFYDFGQGIGEFLGELPWGEILKTAADLLLGGFTSALNGLFDGLEENHPIAGHIAEWLTKAFLAVKIANITGISSLVKLLVSAIVDKIVASKNVEAVSESVAELMNGATGSVSTFGGTLGKVFGTAGIVFAATGAAVGLAEGAASITEAIQGGNGELSQAGGYLHDYTGALENAKTITQDQAEELWKLIEANEDSSNLYDVVAQKLKDYGISAEKATGILEQYGTQAGVSADFVEEMTDKLTLLGDGFSETDGKIDTSKIKISDLKDVLYQLSLKSDDFSGSYKTVWDQLDESQGTLSDSKEAFDLIYTSLKDMGVPLDEFDEALKTEFPEAVTTAQTSAATGMGATSAAVGAAMAGIQKSTEDAMSAASKSVTDNSEDIATASKDNWKDSASSVSTALGTMDTDTKDIMSKVMTTIQSYWSSVLINTNQIWEGVAKKIEKELGNALTAAERISSEIIGTMNNVISKVNGSIGNINNALSGIERSFTFTYNYTNPITKRPGTYRSWLNLPSVNTVPYLATGAVIPPRSEFLAVLGDQKNGRNLEAPEGLIRQIFREESGSKQGNNTYNVSVSASGRNLLDIILEEGELRRNRNGGRNPFKLDE